MVKVIYCEDETVLENMMELLTYSWKAHIKLCDVIDLTHSIGDTKILVATPCTTPVNSQRTSLSPTVSHYNVPAWSHARKQLVLEAVKLLRGHLWDSKLDPSNANGQGDLHSDDRRVRQRNGGNE